MRDPLINDLIEYIRTLEPEDAYLYLSETVYLWLLSGYMDTWYQLISEVIQKINHPAYTALSDQLVANAKKIEELLNENS